MLNHTNASKPLIVITGASQGIGKALAIKFSQENYPCLLLSRNIQRIPEIKNENVIYKQVDVIDFNKFQKAVHEAEDVYGKTECLINNAGFINVGDLQDIAIEKCQQEFDVLVKATLNGIKIVLNDMCQRKSGTIFNISSISDRKASEFSIVYTASKYAVRAMSECLNMAEAK